MSAWLDDVRANIAKIAQGAADDAETKAAVAELKDKLAANEATDADQSAAIAELAEALAASTPPSA